LRIMPNPSADAATISYTLPEPGRMGLNLYDLSGRRVLTLASGYHAAGSASCVLQPVSKDLPRGVYVLRLRANSKIITRELIVE
jgi:hypothetical protein